jgi:hypothetical protein
MRSADRLDENTPPAISERIAIVTADRVREAASHGGIEKRLAELDAEWDVERVLFTMTGINVLMGVLLSRFVSRRWLAYVAAVGSFQLQHGIQGWCPPFALLRRMDVRTRAEIDAERTALKALRGDFATVQGSPEVALMAASRN